MTPLALAVCSDTERKATQQWLELAKGLTCFTEQELGGGQSKTGMSAHVYDHRLRLHLLLGSSHLSIWLLPSWPRGGCCISSMMFPFQAGRRRMGKGQKLGT